MDSALVSVRPVACMMRILSAGIMCAVVATPARGSAQIVTPKTLPVHQSGQFEMYPSARAGMAGVSAALDDSLLDPFVNPAKTARVRESHVVASPYFHSISGGRGGGKSLPLGVGGSSGAWSAVGLFTFQQLDRAGPTWNLPTSERSAQNRYFAGSVARRLSSSTSLGFGAQVASLNAVDGVDLLYAGSDRIVQTGTLADFRLGLVRQSVDDRQLEVVVVHARTDMRHDVRFTTSRWDTAARRIVRTERNDVNEDRTDIWGLHTEYTRSLGTQGWKLGWIGTANRLAHPKIPNYVIQNIPRDPGTTYSFNVGGGVGRSLRGMSFGADLIYEPMFSETWADAAGDTITAGGATIRAGAKTVENTFRFSNVKMRFGAGRDVVIRRDGGTVLGVQMGLGLHSIKYKLGQTNNVQGTFRTQKENWVEWAPTFGLRLRARDLDLMYNFSLTCGPGSCGQGFGGFPVGPMTLEAAAAGGIIAAPSGELFMQSGALKVHKVTFMLPIR